MRLKWAIAICGDWPSVKGAGGNTSSADAPPSVAMRASRAASMLPSAQMPLTIGRRSPISSCAISSTRRCSSKVQEATSVECALMVMAGDAGRRRHVAQVLAEARLVDGEVGIERQQHRRDDAVGNVALVPGHCSPRWPESRHRTLASRASPGQGSWPGLTAVRIAGMRQGVRPSGSDTISRPCPRCQTQRRLTPPSTRHRLAACPLEGVHHIQGLRGDEDTAKKVLANERLLTAPRRTFGLSITLNDHPRPGIAARL